MLEGQQKLSLSTDKNLICSVAKALPAPLPCSWGPRTERSDPMGPNGRTQPSFALRARFSSGAVARVERGSEA